MQKRARAVESQKLRRTMKSRIKLSDPIRENMSVSLAYVRLTLLWLTIISLDVLVGFRFEMLWPFWLFVRAGYESLYKNQNSVITLANHNNAKFSALFVCATVTSDLVCYLFIPVRILVLVASTYCWIHLIMYTHGGFLRTLAALFGDRSQGLSILFLSLFVVVFEFSCRFRCDFLVLARDGNPLATYFNLPNGCSQMQGLSPSMQKGLNNAFGAHCIGFQSIIVFISIQYYFKEWCMCGKQDSVAQRNELANKLLIEAIPSVYQGPKDYSVKTCIDSDVDCSDLLEVNGSLPTPMILPAPISYHNHSTTNGISSSSNKKAAQTVKQTASYMRRGNGRIKSGGSNSTQSTPLQKTGKHRDEDENSETASVCWGDGDEHTRVRVSIIALLWDAILWFFRSSSANNGGGSDDLADGSSCGDDEDDDSLLEEQFKKNNRNNTVTTVAVRKTRGREGKKEKQSNGVDNRHKLSITHTSCDSNGNGDVKRESRETSHDDSTPADHIRNNAEVDRLRAEIRQLRAAQADYRLQISISQNNEKVARQEAVQIKMRQETFDSKLLTSEKLRESDRVAMVQLEKKYADLLNRKNDVERDLIAERRARKEDGRRLHKVDHNEQQREKERHLEKEVDRLRTEAVNREDRIQEMEKELISLRKYKENNDIEAMEVEQRIMKEKMVHLEESLVAENKLKQELFRALGDAKANNAVLQQQLGVENGSAITEKHSPTLVSPTLPPSYHVAVQHPKCESPLMGNYLYAALQQHHSSPTGEHILFESASLSHISTAPDTTRFNNKFGAPGFPSHN